MTDIKEAILRGIPSKLPPKKEYDTSVSHAPNRKDILTTEEKKLAIKNALRYFPENLHPELAIEFAEELKEYGRIYMYRYRPCLLYTSPSPRDQRGSRMPSSA